MDIEVLYLTTMRVWDTTSNDAEMANRVDKIMILLEKRNMLFQWKQIIPWASDYLRWEYKANNETLFFELARKDYYASI